MTYKIEIRKDNSLYALLDFVESSTMMNIRTTKFEKQSDGTVLPGDVREKSTIICGNIQKIILDEVQAVLPQTQKVEATLVAKKCFTVDAENNREAIKMIREKYDNEELDFSSPDSSELFIESALELKVNCDLK